MSCSDLTRKSDSRFVCRSVPLPTPYHSPLVYLRNCRNEQNLRGRLSAKPPKRAPVWRLILPHCSSARPVSLPSPSPVTRSFCTQSSLNLNLRNRVHDWVPTETSLQSPQRETSYSFVHPRTSGPSKRKESHEKKLGKGFPYWYRR